MLQKKLTLNKFLNNSVQDLFLIFWGWKSEMPGAVAGAFVTLSCIPYR